MRGAFAANFLKIAGSPRTSLSRLSDTVGSRRDKAKAAGDEGSVMRFLLRTAFWLSVVILLLPGGSPERPGSTSDVGAGDAVSAAGAAVSDMRQFCVRQPD